jgi:transposase
MSRPTVKELVAAAKAAKGPNGKTALDDYGEALNILHTEKRFTHKEIQTWLAGQGMEYSLSAVRSSTRKWQKAQKARQVSGCNNG